MLITVRTTLSLLTQPVNVHVSYFDASNGALVYATNASGAWTKELLTGSEGVGNPIMHTSMALDTTDSIHVRYYDFFDLNYVNRTNIPGLSFFYNFTE